MALRRADSRVLASVLGVLPPLAITLLVAAYAVNVPYWDTWDWLDRHYGTDPGGPLALLGKYWPLFNEHRVLVPLVLDRALLSLSSLDMLPRVFVKLPLSLGVLALTLHLARRTAPAAPLVAHAAVFSALSFPLTYWPMWMDPRQFSIHLVVLAVAGAIVVATGARAPRARFVSCAALCGVASLSYAPGVLAWPFVGLLLWSRSSRRVGPMLLWVALALAVVVPHGIDWRASAHALQGTATGGLRAIAAACAVAGLPVAPALRPLAYVPTIAMGAAGIVSLCVLSIVALRGDENVRRRALPWVALGGWSISYAALAGWTRGESVAALHDPRFAYVAAQLWLALVGLASVLVFGTPPEPGADPRWRRAFAAGTLVLLACYSAASLRPWLAPGGVGRLSDRLQTGRACLLAYETADDACLELLYPSASRVRAIARRLEVKGARFLRAESPATGR